MQISTSNAQSSIQHPESVNPVVDSITITIRSMSKRKSRSPEPLTLIHIRFCQLKRVPDEFEARLFVFRDDYLYDVETKRNFRIIQHAQPSKSPTGNPSLLIVPNRFKRPAVIFTAASFYFDKNKRVAIATNDIDFAATAAAKISIQHFVPVSPQEPAG
jgi:hypothetical protein